MNKLGILSRDAKRYADLIYQQNLPEIEVVLVSKTLPNLFNYASIDILLGDPDLTAQIVAQCHNLQWLQSTWAGNAPLLNAAKSDYKLCGVKDIFHQAMREYVFAYLLYFSRNITGFTQAQTLNKWSPPTYSALTNKFLGIMGVGNIGAEIANTAKHFGMFTKGFSRTTNNCEFIDQYYTKAQLEEFASGLDYLLCLLPQNIHTDNIIDSTFLSFLPKHCVLINAGRGTVVDDAALISTLTNQTLKAAVLDVFVEEPLPSNHAFWHLNNVYITQHTAAESNPEQIVQLFISNYQRHINNLELNHLLDFSRGY